MDESIIGFKGRLSFIQYMPKKPTKWGIKARVMADSSNGYVSNLNIYTGMTSTLLFKISSPHTGKDANGDINRVLSHRTVLDLVRHLSNQGYRVYTDNFYYSPALFGELKSLGFEECGTVQLNRIGLTKTFKIKDKLTKGKN